MSTPTSPQTADALLNILAERGHANYGEDITQLEHALQCAEFAAQSGRGDAFVIAALLHDVGHLLLGDDEVRGHDTRHEDLGARLLRDVFGDDVAEPVRLHVAAKRYLVAAEADYRASLSAASARSLALQGGPMSASEQAAFEAEPAFDAAVALRRIDEMGKDPELCPRDLDAWRSIARALARPAATT